MRILLFGPRALMMEVWPRAELSPSNKGPYIVVTGYIFMSIMILCTLLKLRPSRKTMVQSPRLDEAILILAMIVAIAECIVVHRAVEIGFGNMDLMGSASQVSASHKLIYIAKLLFTSATNLARLSIFCFIGLLAIQAWQIKLIRVMMLVIIAWTITTLFAYAFQCRLPRPWVSSPARCINQQVFNYFDLIFSIVVDSFSFVLPVGLIWNVRMKRYRRSIIASAFSTRLILCVTEIFQIINLHYPDSEHTYSGYGFDAMIWTQVVMNLSIITASVPSLKPLFSKLHSGAMDTTLRSGSISSTIDTWNRRMQSGTQRSRNESGRPKWRGIVYNRDELVLYSRSHGTDPTQSSNDQNIGEAD